MKKEHKASSTVNLIWNFQVNDVIIWIQYGVSVQFFNGNALLFHFETKTIHVHTFTNFEYNSAKKQKYLKLNNLFL